MVVLFSAIAYYESGRKRRGNDRGLTQECLEAVKSKIHIKETGKTTGSKGSLPLFTTHSLQTTVDDSIGMFILYLTLLK